MRAARPRRRVAVVLELDTVVRLSVLQSRLFWQGRLGKAGGFVTVRQVQANVIREKG